jgi:hypothetical protein
MHEIMNTRDFVSSLKLPQIRHCDEKIQKKFGDFPFQCGCGQVHYIKKVRGLHALMPPIWAENGIYDPSGNVLPVASEDDGILYHCKRGYFTMVRRTQALFKSTVKSEFFIRQMVIDSAENGLGLVINNSKCNLDFNHYRTSPPATKHLSDWSDLEQNLLDPKNFPLIKMPTHNPHLDQAIFSCPCGKKHGLAGNRGDYAFNQSFGGFCVAALTAGSGKKLLYFSSCGYYGLVHIRPSLPVEWCLKVEIKSTDTHNIPILPSTTSNSRLPEEIIQHIRFLNTMAEW